MPDKLARPDDALERAAEFLRPLQQLAKDNVRTHLLAFEIASRRGRLLLQLQSIKRARQIDANNAHLHACIVHFHRALAAQAAQIAPAVRTVIDREIELLFGGRTPAQLNDAFLKANGRSAQHVLQAARSVYELDGGETSRAEALRMVLAVDAFERFTLEVRDHDLRQHSVYSLVVRVRSDAQECIEIYNYLCDGVFGDEVEEALAEFKVKARVLFPYALLFKDAAPSESTTATATAAAPVVEEADGDADDIDAGADN